MTTWARTRWARNPYKSRAPMLHSRHRRCGRICTAEQTTTGSVRPNREEELEGNSKNAPPASRSRTALSNQHGSSRRSSRGENSPKVIWKRDPAQFPAATKVASSTAGARRPWAIAIADRSAAAAQTGPRQTAAAIDYMLWNRLAAARTHREVGHRLGAFAVHRDHPVAPRAGIPRRHLDQALIGARSSGKNSS